MILYKYVPFRSARLIVENSSIGFTAAEHFNDPFEMHALRFKHTPNRAMNVCATGAVKNRCNAAYGVLSLTRQPLNSLMWSHYGDSHRGIVIGIEAEKAGFTCVDRNVIPSSYGEIIYTRTKPNRKDEAPVDEALMKIGEDVSSFTNNNYDLFKNAYLYKSSEWFYEEEVRVVKNIKSEPYISKYKEGKFENSAGKWTQVQVDGRALYCYHFPKEAVKEVYMGCNVFKNVSRAGMDQEDVFGTLSKWKDEGIEVYNCRTHYDSWDLEANVWDKQS